MNGKEKITSGQHFCGTCGSLLASRDSKCVQCYPDSKERKKQQNHMTQEETKSVSQLPSFSFSSSRLLPLIVVGFILGFITFFIIGMFAAPDPYGCTQCDPFLPGYDGPPPIYIDPDFGYDDGYYDDGFYGLGNNVECIFEECVPYGTGGW